MSHTRKAVIASLAALALGGSLVGSATPADAHSYKRVGTVSASEARKLFKETFKQKCLTRHEARHIAHGQGAEERADDADNVIYLYFDGTRKSHIRNLEVAFEDGCARSVRAWRVVTSAAPADTHNYKKVGTVSASEAKKLFKETFKQKCLTMHEARQIAHGQGVTEGASDAENVIFLYFDGSRKSHISTFEMAFEDGCADLVGASKRR